jgi:DNA-binding NtrC family response regulator
MWHVLAIDDDVAALKLYAKCFAMAQLGIQASTATSAEAALRLVEKIPFDAVVCDFLLPGLNGLSFVKACADIQPGLPVILITGFADSHAHLTAAQEGVYALLHKPIAMVSLLTVINRACLYNESSHRCLDFPVQLSPVQARPFH